MDTGETFRHANDAIRKLAPQGSEADTFPFFCECGDIRCHEFVSLTLLEFEGRRAALPPVPVFAAHAHRRPSRSGQGRLTGPRRGRTDAITSSVVQPGSTVG
jgi:hypothetical protein